MPDYNILSFFAAATLPFSFKFISGTQFAYYSSSYRKIHFIEIWPKKNVGDDKPDIVQH
jgi:hypothetical protein